MAVAPRLLLTDWYPPEVSSRLGIDVIHGTRVEGKALPSLSSTALVSQLLATGRPVFVTDWFARDLDRTTPSYPIGPLIRLARTWQEVPSPPSLAEANEEAFAKMTFESTLPQKDSWAATRMEDYARPWSVLAGAFAAGGDAEAAARCRARAQTFAP